MAIAEDRKTRRELDDARVATALARAEPAIAFGGGR